LEPGKYADMVVLDNDPRKVDPVAIRDIKVLQTYVSGRKIIAPYNTTSTATTGATQTTGGVVPTTLPSASGKVVVGFLAFLVLLF
jgi:hypothetical protein